MEIRPLGDITEDMEKLLWEMVDGHNLQKGEILSLISMWCNIHAPHSVEVYEDGSSPVEYYGHKDYIGVTDE